MKVGGMVTIQRIEIIGSQVLPGSLLNPMDAVQRLNGDGFEHACMLGSKIQSIRTKRYPWRGSELFTESSKGLL